MSSTLKEHQGVVLNRPLSVVPTLHRSLPATTRLLAAIGLLLPALASAQSAPTASRTLDPSVFLGGSGVYTGFTGAKNLSVTAGLDLGFRPHFGLSPSVEVRGTYPLDSGQVAGEESVLAGLRIGKRYQHFRPYADFLVGRGELNYEDGGYVVPAQSFRYLQSTTNVLSPGLGTEVDVTPQFALLLDLQLQHWDLPFSTGSTPANPGSIYSKVATVGVVYRFGWLEHGHPAP